MMPPCPYPIADLLPHAAPMVLLDAVAAWDATGITATVTIRDDTRFLQLSQGVPAHIGLEWMAQTCGAFAGLDAMTKGEKVRPGFLLGTRGFAATRGWFHIGELLHIAARQMFLEAGMAVFDCRIDAGTERCAEARLSVFQPPDGAATQELP